VEVKVTEEMGYIDGYREYIPEEGKALYEKSKLALQ
jgi:hypothetical protein